MSTKRLSKVFSHFSSKGPTSPTNANTSDGAETAKTAGDGKDNKEEEKEKKLPTFDELPMFKNFKGCAWSLWGENDQLGTVNLLTEEVVARAAKEIKYDLSSIFFEEGC
jgi:hypothetical protein